MRISFKCLTFPLAMTLACGAGQSVLAQDVKVDAPGATIRVGPNRGMADQRASKAVDLNVQVTTPNVPVEARAVYASGDSSFWVGILGGDLSPELRAHLGPALESPEQGVIVRQVAPESPAAKAGLKEHDILLSANGVPINGMRVLLEEVKKVSSSGGQVAIDLLRAGKQVTVWVKPAARSAPAQAYGSLEEHGFRNDPLEFGGAFGEVFGGDGKQLRLRFFGNDGHLQIGEDGTSVTVNSVYGKTCVRVKQFGGDGSVAKEWVVADASDPKAMEQLPPTVRATVERLLSTHANVINAEEMIPELGGLRERLGGLFRNRDRQIEEMQRQIEELQRRVLGEVPNRDPAAGADGEAPAFDPAAAPTEVEIPAGEK